ncbi:hypothetical protein [Amycolatopsis sp. FDAARGOS 1241]|uniref:hypothetical protein n=1 Tax=Amycolatopsis sp. FDAARGOS 1241 TaxID=2778070 RepID=UPI001950B2E6|nr:hypothetical protein [Amycolatopsis sp. FDAARGOS 1241]QRP50277.1 hypothetical protein I6J71_22845 [Amycolatopsis sp. FDAARGOS 1241]
MQLPLALAELGLIEEYEFVVQRLAGHGPTLFAGLSKLVDVKLVGRLEFGSGAVAMRCERRRSAVALEEGESSAPPMSTSAVLTGSALTTPRF